LLTFGKKGTTKAFEEPVLVLPDENDEMIDIDLKEIEEKEKPVTPENKNNIIPPQA
jgi:hypothetical protein